MKMYRYNVRALGRNVDTICLQDRQAWYNFEVLNALVAWRFIQESEAKDYKVYNDGKNFLVKLNDTIVLELIEIDSFCPYAALNF